MSTFNKFSIAELRSMLANKDLSAVELTESYIYAIEKAQPHLNAYVLPTPDKALAMAKESDARRASGQVGNLEGIPLGVKDNFCTNGIRTTACSRILGNFVPPYESTVTTNLWRDGAVMLGKLSCDEFAMGSCNEYSCFGPVGNPWKSNTDNKLRVPGGSSGGSASAVASWLCAGATGSDTGGSVRQPASLCGVVGVKPTYGRCSRWGLIAFASSLDQAGPLARSVRDAAILMNSFASFDSKDSTSVDTPVPDYETFVGQSIKGKVIGIPGEYSIEGMSQEIHDMWQNGIKWLQDAGATIKAISLPHTQYALPAYYIISMAEASSNLARYDGMRYGLRVKGNDYIDTCERTRSCGFGPEVKRRILAGTYILSSGHYDEHYVRAQKIRSLVKRDFELVFQSGVSAILTPATPSAASPVGENCNMDPVEVYLNDIFTVTVNMAGLPGIAIPAMLSQTGLPLGLQLIGHPFDEGTLFSIGDVIEKAAGVFGPKEWWVQ